MRNLLAGMKGKFILSINDVREIRALFDGFKMESVSTVYSVSKESKKRVNELLISNY